MLNLMGSIRTPSGLYDAVASASKLAMEDPENKLIEVLTHHSHKKVREEYLNNLVDIINTAAIIYNLDEVIICGGLADAVSACNYPLENMLNTKLEKTPFELKKSVGSIVLKEGNTLQLIGAIALARGEAVALNNKVSKSYDSIKKQNPYKKDIQFQEIKT